MLDVCGAGSVGNRIFVSLNIWSEHVVLVCVTAEPWRQALTKGDAVDGADSLHKWYTAKVLLCQVLCWRTLQNSLRLLQQILLCYPSNNFSR